MITKIDKNAIWFCDLTYTQQTIAADVMPAAVAGIATYFKKNKKNINIKIYKYPEKLIEDINENTLPIIVAFSNYVWNKNLSIEFAKEIKKINSNIAIVFGGPNYPNSFKEQYDWLIEHPIVDFYIVKEGEVAFFNFFTKFEENNFNINKTKLEKIESCHAIFNKDFNFNQNLSRLVDLDEIPSPYTSGFLDDFFDGKLLPIIQTNRGCPFGCTFCVEGVDYYNKIRKKSSKNISDEIKYIGKKMYVISQNGGRNDLFIADSNFGMYKDDIETSKNLAYARDQYKWPEYINVATGKNQKERVLAASEIISGALRLSGSVQSLNKEVLKNIKRDNINSDDLFELGLKANEIGANSYSEIILALPGDSLDAHLETIKTIMKAGFTNIYLFQLMLLPGTELALKETKEKYEMKTMYRVLPRCYGYYTIGKNDVVAAEIEEICVANNTLSFNDYLYCRKLHLIITIFYNDGIFRALIELLKNLNINPFDWMLEIMDSKKGQRLESLLNNFLTDTKNELWLSKEDLEKFTKNKKNIDKFINGELGNNLLFVYKTKAITENLEELAEVARMSFVECLRANNVDFNSFKEFIDNAISYHFLSSKDIFMGNKKFKKKFAYNIEAFLNNPDSEISKFSISPEKEITFLNSPEQIAIISKYKKIYGSSSVSIGRILSKVHVKKLFRENNFIENENKFKSIKSIEHSGLQS